MKRKTRWQSPFSDGSHDDNEYWNERAYTRRAALTAHDVRAKIIEHMSQWIDILSTDIERYRSKGDEIRRQNSQERLYWCRALIDWIEHNV